MLFFLEKIKKIFTFVFRKSTKSIFYPGKLILILRSGCNLTSEVLGRFILVNFVWRNLLAKSYFIFHPGNVLFIFRSGCNLTSVLILVMFSWTQKFSKFFLLKKSQPGNVIHLEMTGKSGIFVYEKFFKNMKK